MRHILKSILQSLKLQIILFTVAIFIVCILLFSVYLGQMLRQDMQQLLGDQQVATVTQVAHEINTNFEERIRALELVAGGIDSSMLGNHAKLQAYLEQRPFLEVLFNGGIYAIGKNGIGLAEVPVIGRVGTDYMTRDYVATPMTEGKATVGKAVMGKKIAAPSFAMGVPIKDAQGRVMGVLAGSTDLSKPNFLNNLNVNGYGKTGGFLIVNPKGNQIVTATSRGFYQNLVMKPIPASEANPILYKRIKEGFDGTAVNVNPAALRTCPRPPDCRSPAGS